ncbi:MULTISPECIES: FAD-dependent oxidoreductase [unclassified Sporosarcina]|uniref:FAD-dependent oxidoreductase n=1 Tax=unclassified Sporosarcina TaxID=2647733 RepID=UPI000C16FF87|nr:MULTISPECIES: FAD-dependent oxidoreductase [unclassified Sporosarcina]PID04663.1 3-ketosteroid-delta-1-dehydrogenase [Sporosarcina sp. P30]PID07770.1 3-ketosteroid-delta-1-dehydrogenase [Sporosarcina sp. P31]PID11003.1 3-ketosteroid-delta-1-dehydrogenase [Sporosarcina sp. P32b]
MEWDYEYDVIVVGSGASGFSAAITGKKEGLKTVLIEKEKVFGGASALSGGGVWIPNNRYLVKGGVQDSFQEAKTYLDSTVGDKTSDEMKETYLKKGIDMMDYLHETSEHMRFTYAKDYSDYYPHLAGGKGEGRSIEPTVFNLNKLGGWRGQMKAPAMDTKGFVMTGQDFRHINMITRTWTGKKRSLTLGWRLVKHLVLRANYSALGQALIGRLAMTYKELGGELWLDSPFIDFIIEDDEISGIKIMKDGKETRVKASKGVIFASGGFSQKQSFREKYLPAPTDKTWTSSPQGQTGDLLEPAQELGAKLGFMDKVWGAPSIIDHTGKPFFLVADRAIPSMIITDQDGNRYINEPTPYHEFVDTMYAHNEKSGGKAIHSWIILDHKAKKRHLFAGLFPGQDFPKEYYEHHVVLKSETIAGLEEQLAMPQGNLVKTVERFNGFAETGEDLDFHRGETKHDQYYGDPTLKNPNLDAIDKGPFYALKIYPGDIGTKGGVVIDTHARVLKEDGTPIEGLYACGNCSAAVMGESYPGPGATIGPGMTFGHIAALHCKEKAKSGVTL